MPTTTESGFLVLADLTRYTAYLADRWSFLGIGSLDDSVVDVLRTTKGAAYERLATAITTDHTQEAPQ